MKRVVQVFSLLLVLLMMFTAGCDLLNDEDDEDENGDNGTDIVNGDGASAEEYYPLTDGAQWAYQGSDPLQGSYNSVSSVNGTKTIDGKTYSVINDSYANTELEMRVADNILYFYMDDPTGLMKGVALDDSMTASSKHARYLDFNKGVDETWEVFSGSFTFSGITTTMTMTGKFVGTESVNTPLGTFEDCLKFEIVTDTQTSTVTASTTSYIWLAKNIGTVKSLTQTPSGNAQRELTGYNIPGGASAGTIPDTGDTGGGDGGDGGDSGDGTYSISGMAYDEDTYSPENGSVDPIEGATIMLTWSDQSTGHNYIDSTHTAADGTYSFTGLEGDGLTYVVYAFDPGGWSFGSSTQPFTLSSDKTDVNFPATWSSLGEQGPLIQGYMETDQGYAVEYNEVQLLDGTTVIQTRHSNQYGYFFFYDLEPGTYTVKPIHDTYSFTPETQDVTVADENIQMDTDFIMTIPLN